MTAPHDVWKDLAGEAYKEIMECKDRALAHLVHADRDVRIAAIHICASHWDCSADPRFVATCRKLASTDPDECVRVHAIQAFGNAFTATQDSSASHFLAITARAEANSGEVRAAAYWALRVVQHGETEEDTVKRCVAVAKKALSRLSGDLSEEQLKHAFLGSGRYADLDWESAERIDWDYVDQFVSHV